MESAFIGFLAGLFCFAVGYWRGHCVAKDVAKKKAKTARAAVGDVILHVCDNALFQDDQGKAVGDYNSEQVSLRWEKFYKLSDEAVIFLDKI